MIGAQIPQAGVLFFPDRIERPMEAPILALEKKHCNEELQRIARPEPQRANGRSNSFKKIVS